VIWVYLYKQRDFVKTFFQRESNVWNFAKFGLFFQMNKIQWKKGFVIRFDDINTKPKSASLRSLVERPSDCRDNWTNLQPKQEICRKISRLQFCSFLKISWTDFSHVEINRGVRGTCFYFQMTKTSGIHKIDCLEICLTVRHVVSTQELAIKV